MRLIATISCIVGVLAFGCRTTDDETPDGESNVKDIETAGEQAEDPVLGLDILDNQPVVTEIPENPDVEDDWEFTSGREYWLYSTRGNFMTFSTSYYHPYQNQQECEGLQTDPNSACSVKPGAVAQACQRQASITLKAIMAAEPEIYKQMKASFGGSFSLFGWMNDGHSDGEYATPPWQEPFIWRGSADAVQIGGGCPSDFKYVSGYIKWVSSVDKQRTCRTPSLGQLLALLQSAKSCLEQNNPAPEDSDASDNTSTNDGSNDDTDSPSDTGSEM